MTNSLAEIAKLIRREIGVVLPAAREAALRSAVARAAPGLDPGAFLRATSDPVIGRALLERLIDEVTVQETSFVRDRGQLDVIGWHGLLQGARAAGSPTIRVWSAGCASGEEAYTLALLADQAFAPGPAPVDVLGTDISRAALAAAAAGQYRERAVGALDGPLRSRYFKRQADGTYLVGERLRRLVRFGRHNLASDPIPPSGEAGFDLVTCRNVLIYFEQPMAEHVIGSLERALRPGGMLLVGAADALRRRTGQPAAMARGQATAGQSSQRPLRRPLGRQPALSREERLTAALGAADKGDRDSALAQVAALLAADPLDADAHFIRGLVALEAGEPAMAASALRRALFTDAAFALAAFTLGRAYDAMGDATAARRAYQRVLQTLDSEDHRHDLILRQVHVGDIAAACRARLEGRP